MRTLQTITLALASAVTAGAALPAMAATAPHTPAEARAGAGALLDDDVYRSIAHTMRACAARKGFWRTAKPSPIGLFPLMSEVVCNRAYDLQTNGHLDAPCKNPASPGLRELCQVATDPAVRQAVGY